MNRHNYNFIFNSTTFLYILVPSSGFLTEIKVCFYVGKVCCLGILLVDFILPSVN